MQGSLVLRAGEVILADAALGARHLLGRDSAIALFYGPTTPFVCYFKRSDLGTPTLLVNLREALTKNLRKLSPVGSSVTLLYKLVSVQKERDLISAEFHALLLQLATELKIKVTLDGKGTRTEPVEIEVLLSPNKLRIHEREHKEIHPRKTKVLIVDDSKTICQLLTRILNTDPELEVVATASLPSHVEALIEKHRPDVITLDIHMPEMNGVELLAKILPKYRIPTIMISSISMEESPQVLEALEIGAVDYIQKPSFSEIDSATPIIIEKVKAARTAKLVATTPMQTAEKPMSNAPLDTSRLIVIGSSTGGTEALKGILTRLPENIPPILIVQHIPPVFSKAFANRMNELCPFEVLEAKDGDEVRPNRVLIAPGAFQMSLIGRGNNLSVKVEDAPPMNRHKPSVDYLFKSVAKLKNLPPIAGVILTGMGADGADGLLELRKLGAHTIAQDEASCVVFGMPKEAIKRGAAEKIAPLLEIATLLEIWAQKKR